MKPKDGEFWIVEFRGEVTIGQSIAGGARWQFVGDMKGHSVDDDPTFRAVRKLDIGALLDQGPPVAWRWRPKQPGARWALLDHYPEGAVSDRSETEALFVGHPQSNQAPSIADVAAAQRRIMANSFYRDKFGDSPVAAFGFANSALIGADLGPRLDRALEDNQRLRDEVDMLRVEQMKGLRRMLWLIVKAAGAPGVKVDRQALESFDPLNSELTSSTDAAGNIHIEAKVRGEQ